MNEFKRTLINFLKGVLSEKAINPFMGSFCGRQLNRVRHSKDRRQDNQFLSKCVAADEKCELWDQLSSLSVENYIWCFQYLLVSTSKP